MVPIVAFPIAYLTEKYPQHWLALLVHRGRPPTTLGTWPSGGCARALLVYGLVAWFVSRRWRGKRVAAIAWSVVIVSQVTEAYTRVYLLKHWFTDVLPGGILFGGLLLTVWTAAVWLMDHTGDNRDRTTPTSGSAGSDPAVERTQTAA